MINFSPGDKIFHKVDINSSPGYFKGIPILVLMEYIYLNQINFCYFSSIDTCVTHT